MMSENKRLHHRVIILSNFNWTKQYVNIIYIKCMLTELYIFQDLECSAGRKLTTFGRLSKCLYCKIVMCNNQEKLYEDIS